MTKIMRGAQTPKKEDPSKSPENVNTMQKNRGIHRKNALSFNRKNVDFWYFMYDNIHKIAFKIYCILGIPQIQPQRL